MWRVGARDVQGLALEGSQPLDQVPLPWLVIPVYNKNQASRRPPVTLNKHSREKGGRGGGKTRLKQIMQTADRMFLKHAHEDPCELVSQA